MKKSFTLLASLFVSVSMMAAVVTAQPLQPKRISAKPVGGIELSEITVPATALNLRHSAPATIDEGEVLSMEYSVCYDPYTFIKLGVEAPGVELAFATEINADAATKYAGNDITQVGFFTGINGQTNTNTIKSATVFLTYDLQEAPFETKEVELPSTAGQYVVVTFDKPYTLEADTPVYMGVKFTCSSQYDYPLVVDYMLHDTYDGGYVAVYENGEPTWNNYSENIGFVCMYATISGTSLPVNQAATMVYDAPVSVYDNQKFSASFAVGNQAANDIASVEVEYQVGDLAAQTSTVEFENPIPFNYMDVVTVSDLSYPTAGPDPVEVTFKVTKVNGEPNTSEDNSASFSVLVVPEGKGYTRNVVIEEFTGTWCGYCPAGIVTMEAIREDFTDGTLIPVCVHVDDEMSSAAFNPLIQQFVTGVPSAVLNRLQDVFPGYYDEVKAAYEQVRAIPAIAKVEATAEIDAAAKVIKMETTSEFTFDMEEADQRFALCFVVTEDNVGPYKQTNYFAGDTEDVGGWESLPGEVETMYNDVARSMFSYTGLEGSVPATVEAGQQYTFSYNVPLSNALVKNKENLNVVTYVINLTNGSIENAFGLTSSQIKDETSSISDINVEDANAPVEYFNLQGVKVANPANGIYIMRQGGKASKVYVK